MEHEDIKVFLGPTLGLDEARKLLDADYLRPASRGDIYRASKSEPRIMVLIDGTFESGAAVLHNEILWALSKGITLLGAASIGALRAAELAPFGMIGVGRIFEAYKNGSLERDDAVAVVHGPGELDYPLLSIALVDVWATLERAFEIKILTANERDLLKDIAGKIFYKQLSLTTLLKSAIPHGFRLDRAKILTEYINTHGFFSQKHADAIDTLRAVASETIPLTQTADPAFVFERTSAWRKLVAELDEHEATTPVKTSTITSETELAMIGLVLAEKEAQRRGFVLGPSEFAQAARHFRRRNKLSKFSDVQKWMEIAQLNHADYVGIIEDEFYVRHSGVHTAQYSRSLISRVIRHQRSALASVLKL